MTSVMFPADPGQRKVVLVLRQQDVERCQYEPGAADVLLDDEAFVLPFPLRESGDFPLAMRNIQDAGLSSPGLMLLQSPYDPDSYEEASLAVERFALAKHMHFSNLCMLLGAREVEVEQIELHTRSGKTTVKVAGEHSGVGANVSVDQEEVDRFCAQLSLRDEFTGAEPDLEAAESLLRRTRLWSDPQMRTLLDMRRSSTNQLKERRLTLSLSSEAKENLKVVARLKVPTFVTLSAQFQRDVVEEHNFKVTVVVRF